MIIKYVSIGSNELDTYLDYAVFNLIAIFILHASPEKLGILGSCFALPFLFSGYLFGKIFDKYKVRLLRGILFSINACAMLFIASADSMIVLYSIAFIKTMARCGINVSNTKLNKDDKESIQFYEIYGYLINLSRIIMPLIVVGLYNHIGVLAIVFLSIFLSLSAILSTFIDPETYNFSNTNSKHKSTRDYDYFSLIRFMMNEKTLGILITAYTISNLAFFLSSDMLGLFFKEIGQSENSIGIIISLMGVGGFIGTKLASFLTKKLKPNLILIFSVLVNTVAFICFGFFSPITTSVLFFYSAIILVGLASGITFFAIRYGVRNTIGYEVMGKATGIIQMISSIVAIIMPVVGGIIAGYFGINITFRITSIIFACTLLYFSLYITKKNRNKIYEW